MNTNEKATLEYRVVTGKSPKDQSTILRPLIVNKETYDTARALRFCVDNGFVTGGKYYACYGVVNGFLEGLQQLGKDGRDILLNGWLRIHPELRGTIDPVTKVMSSENELHVCVSAQKDLRRTADDFNWTCVDDHSKNITIKSICSATGKKGAVLKGKVIVAEGSNIVFNTTWGDAATITYEGLGTPISITPVEQGETYLRFDWPTALDELEDGTILTFDFKFHGKEGGAEQPQQQFAVFKVA